MLRVAGVATVLVLCCSLAQAQTCQSMNGTDVCGSLKPYDCSDRWSFFVSSVSDGVSMLTWYGSISAISENAESCTTIDGCSLCLVFDDIEYTGQTVSAGLTLESTCGDIVEVGLVQGDNLACCDPNYQHMPLEFDVNDISIFDFMDDAYARDASISTTIETAFRKTIVSIGHLLETNVAIDSRGPPDYGVLYDDGCFFMMGIPMFCTVPTLSLCSDKPVAQLFSFLGFELDFGNLGENQQSCVSLNGIDLCLAIDDVEITANAVSYTTYLVMLGMDVSGPTSLTYTFPDCSCV